MGNGSPFVSPFVGTPAELYLSQIAGQAPASQQYDDLPNVRDLRHVGIENMPHIWMPPQGSEPLNKTYSIACPAVGTTGNVIGSFTLKPNWWAVIHWVALCQSGPGFPEGSGGMTWRILSAGNPVSDFGNLTIQLGQIQGAIVPSRVAPIIIRPNSTVQAVCDNASLNPANVYVFAILRGWQWAHRGRWS